MVKANFYFGCVDWRNDLSRIRSRNWSNKSDSRTLSEVVFMSSDRLPNLLRCCVFTEGFRSKFKIGDDARIEVVC